MKRYALLLYILFLAAAVRAATPRPQPLYIVNGKETSEIRSIPPEDIENVEMLPADEETIARYGQRAAHGVMLITLRIRPRCRSREACNKAEKKQKAQNPARGVHRYRRACRRPRLLSDERNARAYFRQRSRHAFRRRGSHQFGGV